MKKYSALLKLGRPSSNLKMGIVGMANVGKSTTFNHLTKQKVPAENFPFCTIDPNHAIVKIKDERFEYLCNQFKPKKETGPTLHITDIAGLVKGASEGHGLGNEFLSHIAQVDGIYQVVRAFKDEKILHTEGLMDPVRDLEIISNELIAKDLQFITKRREELKKKFDKLAKARMLQDDQKILLEVIEKVFLKLKEKCWVRFENWNDRECEQLNKLNLLTAKPQVYLINGSDQLGRIEDWVKKYGGDSKVIPYSAAEDVNVNEILGAGYNLLNLIRFYTVGEDEVKSWSIRRETQAPKAASQIHTDFEKGFISADVIGFDDFKKLGDQAKKMYQKKFRKEGKTYVVKDGDIIQFKCKIVQ